MSKKIVEAVIRMPPISMRTIESIGGEVLGALCPEALRSPTSIDMTEWVDRALPFNGIYVTPVHESELPDSEAETLPDGTGPIDILVRQSHWHDLFTGGRMAFMPRATVAHELAHAVLHVPVIRRRRDNPERQHLLQRVLNSNIKVYENPEWQAWALAGCILAPRTAIELMPYAGVTELADVFEVSASMMMSHLRRLKIVREL